MIGFLLASQNLPFTVAITLMLGIACLEGITTLLGVGISSLLESVVPDLDLDVDLDSPEMSSGSILTKVLGWLRIGEVPALILFIVFLTAFGIIGLFLQAAIIEIAGFLLPMAIASVGAFFLALPVVRLLGGILSKIMPKDETEAVSESSFIGRVAVITLGRASSGKPAQAKLQDQHGQAHYIMVEPDASAEVFETQTAVLLVSQHGSTFKCIRNPSTALVDP